MSLPVLSLLAYRSVSLLFLFLLGEVKSAHTELGAAVSDWWMLYTVSIEE